MKKALLLLTALLPAQAFAADISCSGTISNVLDYPAQCNGNLSFQINATLNKWICSTSAKGNAMILSAQATKKTVAVYIHNASGTMTCATVTHYITPRYMILKTG
jgi:hypothetical protein